MTGRLNKTLWTLMAVLSLAIALFSYRYLLRIGPLAPTIMQNLFARPWLDVHVAGAATALLIGPFQFLPGLRARVPALHRWMGRSYVLGCLVGGAGGLVMAFGTTAGPIASAGFGGLAVLWLFTTIQAWRRAAARRFVEHRQWMIRSFALTLAAVTLRLYVPLAPLTDYVFVDAYRAISFLCWVPNLIVAEIYIRATAMRRLRAQAA